MVGALSRVFPALRGPAEPGQVTFADTYHGKVMPLDAAKRLVTVERDIRVENLERVIPYARARDIVLQHPDHITVSEIATRASAMSQTKPMLSSIRSPRIVDTQW